MKTDLGYPITKKVYIIILIDSCHLDVKHIHISILTEFKGVILNL